MLESGEGPQKEYQNILGTLWSPGKYPKIVEPWRAPTSEEGRHLGVAWRVTLVAYRIEASHSAPIVQHARSPRDP